MQLCPGSISVGRLRRVEKSDWTLGSGLGVRIRGASKGCRGWGRTVHERQADHGVVGVVLRCDGDLSAGFWGDGKLVDWWERNIVGAGGNNVLRGNLVRVVTPSTEPQGGVLSTCAAHARSAGHQKAAGPLLSEAAKTLAAVAARSAKRREVMLMSSAGVGTKFGLKGEDALGGNRRGEDECRRI